MRGHLYCTVCETRVGIYFTVPGVAWAVCDCTGDDGDLDKVHTSDVSADIPERWERRSP